MFDHEQLLLRDPASRDKNVVSRSNSIIFESLIKTSSFVMFTPAMFTPTVLCHSGQEGRPSLAEGSRKYDGQVMFFFPLQSPH